MRATAGKTSRSRKCRSTQEEAVRDRLLLIFSVRTATCLAPLSR